MHRVIKLIHFLVRNKDSRIIGSFYLDFLKVLGLEIPKSVKLGKDIELAHGAVGLVVHPNTTIEDRVRIYQNVTLGRADVFKSFERSNMEGILVKENAILCAGAKILCKDGLLTVGKNTVIGANSVLLCSTGDNEIWAGIPAKKIRDRRVDEF